MSLKENLEAIFEAESSKSSIEFDAKRGTDMFWIDEQSTLHCRQDEYKRYPTKPVGSMELLSEL